MIEPINPINEEKRLEFLRKLHILETPVEERFDRITRIVCQALDVPIAAISLLDSDRQWFKSIQGLDVSETSRKVSFCGHTILQDEPLVVRDTLKDERFWDNPLVTSDPKIRFYAGCPLTIGDNFRIGSLCAIDQTPRDMTDDQIMLLSDLAAMVQSELNNIALTEAHHNLIHDLKEAERAALIDPLTRLWNRAGGQNLLEREWDYAIRKGTPLSVAMVDIDHFKRINDSFGHCIGDQVLQKISEILLGSLRTFDVVSRWGGEEFLIILPGCEKRDLYHALERLMTAVRNLKMKTDIGGLTTTVSIGAATIYPKFDADMSSFIKLVDMAMYDAKENGRDQFKVDAKSNYYQLVI